MATIAQDLFNIEKILKEEYLPFLNNALNVEPSPFLEEIKKETLNASEGKFGTRIGIGGGFGMSAERVATPEAHAPIYNGFNYESKDAYVDIEVSNKTVKLGQSNTAAMVNAVMDNIEASHEAAKWNVGRMLYGDGSGKLATVVSAQADEPSAGYTTITVDSLKNVIEGLTIDVVNTSGAVVVKAIQIVAIDDTTPTAPKVVVRCSLTNPAGATVNASAITAGCILTAQNSYNREITGLGALFNDTTTTIYGVSKAENPFVVPKSIVIGSNGISELDLTDAVTWAADRKNAKINMFLCGDEAFRAYESYMRTVNTRIVEKHKYVGGAVGYEIVCGSQTAVIVRDRFVPAQEMWGVDTTMFTLKQTGWDFAEYQGSVFTLQPGTSVYRALLANYMELVCSNPGAMVKLTGITA